MPKSDGNEMGVDDVVTPGGRQQTAYEPTVIQRKDLGGLQESRQAGLAATVSPDLGNKRFGCSYRCPAGGSSGEKRPGGGVRAVDRDQEASIENHRS